jgi:hypothetical protein
VVDEVGQLVAGVVALEMRRAFQGDLHQQRVAPLHQQHVV